MHAHVPRGPWLRLPSLENNPRTAPLSLWRTTGCTGIAFEAMPARLRHLAADACRGMGKSVLRFRILRQSGSVIAPRLREIPLRLDHLQHGINAEFLALFAQLQTLVGQLDAAPREADLIQPAASALIGIDHLLGNRVTQFRIAQPLCA